MEVEGEPTEVGRRLQWINKLLSSISQRSLMNETVKNNLRTALADFQLTEEQVDSLFQTFVRGTQETIDSITPQWLEENDIENKCKVPVSASVAAANRKAVQLPDGLTPSASHPKRTRLAIKREIRNQQKAVLEKALAEKKAQLKASEDNISAILHSNRKKIEQFEKHRPLQSEL